MGKKFKQRYLRTFIEINVVTQSVNSTKYIGE